MSPDDPGPRRSDDASRTEPPIAEPPIAKRPVAEPPVASTELTPTGQADAQLRTMLDAVDATIALFGDDGTLVAFNRRAQERALAFYGVPIAVGERFPNPYFDEILERVLRGESVSERHGPDSREADVAPYWVDMRIVPVRDADGVIVGACYHSVDVTDAVLREREEARSAGFRRAVLELMSDVLAPDAGSDLHERALALAVDHVDGARDGSVIVKGDDGDYRIAAVHGYDGEALGTVLPASFVERRRPSTTAVMWRAPDDAMDGLEPETAARVRRMVRWETLRATLSVPIRVGGRLVAFLSLNTRGEGADFGPQAVADGELLAAQIGALLQRLALEASLRAERSRLEHLAHHDALTNVANRTLMGARLTLTMERDRRAGLVTALFLIDLDGFKRVNDDHGHVAGDALLVVVGGALQDAVRAMDTVARWGGDEFAVLAGGVRDLAMVRRMAVALHTNLTATLRDDPFGEAVRASMGVAVVRDADPDAEALLHRAAMAMYRAKGAGGDRVAFDDDLSGVD